MKIRKVWRLNLSKSGVFINSAGIEPHEMRRNKIGLKPRQSKEQRTHKVR